ncbi:hypothetical protein WDW86_01255 [Bdellovibrionota bacterium FG-2]
MTRFSLWKSVPILLLFASSPLTLADDTPCLDEPVGLPGAPAETAAIKESAREAYIQDLLKDGVRQCCEIETFRGVGNLMLGANQSEADLLRKKPHLAGYLAAHLGEDYYAPWQISVFPREDLAKTALNLGYEYEGTKSCFQSVTDAMKFLQEPSKPPSKDRINEIKSTIATLDLSLEDQNLGKTGAIVFGGKLLACTSLEPTSAANCTQGLEQIRTTMTQQVAEVSTLGHPMNFSLLPTLKEVLTNPKYVEGVRLAALKIGNKIYAAPSARNGNLFNDIYGSFVESGLSPKDAQECTFVRLYAIDPKCTPASPVKEGLSLISLAMPLLDIQYASSGHFYSYPTNIHTTCNQAKPYHFWMSAFLAREVAKSTGDPKAGSAAAYTAEKGYQVVADAGYRAPARVYVVDTFEAFNNVTRMDLAYSAAGAVFGANSVERLSTKELNIDKGVVTLLRSASDRRIMKPDEAKALAKNPPRAYLEWSSRFNPNSAYQLYK